GAGYWLLLVYRDRNAAGRFVSDCAESICRQGAFLEADCHCLGAGARGVDRQLLPTALVAAATAVWRGLDLAIGSMVGSGADAPDFWLDHGASLSAGNVRALSSTDRLNDAYCNNGCYCGAAARRPGRRTASVLVLLRGAGLFDDFDAGGPADGFSADL